MMLPRLLLVFAAAAAAACGSTEPTVDPNTMSVVGTFQLESQKSVDPNGAFIPNNVPYVVYTSDQYTLGADGSYARAWAGTFHLGAQSAPATGAEQGTYQRNLSTLTFRGGAAFVATATITTTGFEMRDSYFIYPFRRGP